MLYPRLILYPKIVLKEGHIYASSFEGMSREKRGYYFKKNMNARMVC
jgi:hypothetical protein